MPWRKREIRKVKGSGVAAERGGKQGE
jgi:hypothetical protein